jgi:hypothetical protein
MPSGWFALPVVLAASTSGYAAVYLTEAAAQSAIFPSVTLTPVAVKLTREQRNDIERVSGIRVRVADLLVRRGADGSWFIVDQVLGKHEYITYALGLTPAGSIVGVEIMEYRETYGEQIRQKTWRDQFAGKTVAAPLKLDQDIRNITGATLSSRHLTDGIKRLLATHELVLKRLP